MRATEHDLPQSIGDLLGGNGGPLQLNNAESAVCPRCGQEPRLHTHTTSGGQEVVAWIPAEHDCRAKRATRRERGLQ